MGRTEQNLDTLAPSGYESPELDGKNYDSDKTVGYAWAVFYIIILTLVIFFILYAFNSPGDGHSQKKGGKRSKLDKTAYGWNLLIAFVAAIIVVGAVSYYRRRK